MKAGYTKKGIQMQDSITIRQARTDDEVALRRLAQLDDSEPLRGDALLGIVDGELQAALSNAGCVIADPFRRTSELVELLRVAKETA
jgi:hypothetical protein